MFEVKEPKCEKTKLTDESETDTEPQVSKKQRISFFKSVLQPQSKTDIRYVTSVRAY